MLGRMPGIVSLLIARFKESQALRLVLIGAACLLAGAGLFALTQHLSYATALYWAVTTATTVGYGDVIPKNPAGRAIAVVVMLTTIPLFASAFALLAGAVVTTHLRRLLGVGHQAVPEQALAIYGFSSVVPRVAAELSGASRQVVVVANVDRSALPEDVELITADPTSEDAVRRTHPGYVGRDLKSIRAEHPGLVLGAVHSGHVLVGVAHEVKLAAGDQLIVVEADPV
jgi:voltage-gated potassium channel